MVRPPGRSLCVMILLTDDERWSRTDGSEGDDARRAGGVSRPVGEGAVPRPAALPLDLPETRRRLRGDDGPVEGAAGNPRGVVPHFGFPGGARRDLRRRDGEVPLPSRGRRGGRKRSDPGRGAADLVHLLPGGVPAPVRILRHRRGRLPEGHDVRRDRPAGLLRRETPCGTRGAPVERRLHGVGGAAAERHGSFADDRISSCRSSRSVYPASGSPSPRRGSFRRCCRSR